MQSISQGWTDSLFLMHGAKFDREAFMSKRLNAQKNNKNYRAPIHVGTDCCISYFLSESVNYTRAALYMQKEPLWLDSHGTHNMWLERKRPCAWWFILIQRV